MSSSPQSLFAASLYFGLQFPRARRSQLRAGFGFAFFFLLFFPIPFYLIT